MKTLIVTTITGGTIRLEQCTALGLDHIAHSHGVYAIQPTDTITEITH